MIKLSKMTDCAVVCPGFLAQKLWYLMPDTNLFKETGSALIKVEKLIKLPVSKRDLMRGNRISLNGCTLNINFLEIIVVEIIAILHRQIILTSYLNKYKSSFKFSEFGFLDGKWKMKMIYELISKSLNNISLKKL